MGIPCLRNNPELISHGCFIFAPGSIVEGTNDKLKPTCSPAHLSFVRTFASRKIFFLSFVPLFLYKGWTRCIIYFFPYLFALVRFLSLAFLVLSLQTGVFVGYSIKMEYLTFILYKWSQIFFFIWNVMLIKHVSNRTLYTKRTFLRGRANSDISKQTQYLPTQKSQCAIFWHTIHYSLTFARQGLIQDQDPRLAGLRPRDTTGALGHKGPGSGPRGPHCQG